MNNLFNLHLNEMKKARLKLALIQDQISTLDKKADSLVWSKKEVDEDVLLEKMQEISKQILEIRQERDIACIREHICQTNLEKIIKLAFESCTDVLPTDKRLNKTHIEKLSKKLQEILSVEIEVHRRSGFFKNDLAIRYNQESIIINEIIYSFLDDESKINTNRVKYKSLFIVENPKANAEKIFEIQKEIEKKEEEIKALKNLESDYQFKLNA